MYSVPFLVVNYQTMNTKMFVGSMNLILDTAVFSSEDAGLGCVSWN